MKKIPPIVLLTLVVTITTTLLFVSTILPAQAFLGLAGTNKGFSMQGGYMSHKIEVKAAFRTGLNNKADIAKIQYFNAGKLIDFGNNWTLTPSVGGGHYEVDKFDEWNRGGEVEHINSWHWSYGIEAGYNRNDAKFFLEINHVKELWVGLGMKFYMPM